MNNRGRGYYATRTVVRVLFYGAILALIIALSGYVWWDGDSFCPGTMTGCVGL